MSTEMAKPENERNSHLVDFLEGRDPNSLSSHAAYMYKKLQHHIANKPDVIHFKFKAGLPHGSNMDNIYIYTWHLHIAFSWGLCTQPPDADLQNVKQFRYRGYINIVRENGKCPIEYIKQFEQHRCDLMGIAYGDNGGVVTSEREYRVYKVRDDLQYKVEGWFLQYMRDELKCPINYLMMPDNKTKLTAKGDTLCSMS